MSGLFSRKKTLSKALEKWIKSPDTDLSDALNDLSDEGGVKEASESKLVCDALAVVKSQLQTSFDETIERNIYELTVLFQEASTEEAARHLNDHGIPLLVDILSIIQDKQYKSESFSSCEPMILKMLALYSNPIGLNKLSHCISIDFRDDDYLWSVTLNALTEHEEKYSPVINGLAGKIPTGFLGISYLDMCNAIAIQNSAFKHPFNSPTGFAYLAALTQDDDPEKESYIVSATASSPFLNKEYQESLLKTVEEHKNIDIQLEAAWAGAKAGNQRNVGKLIDIARNYRYSKKASHYLEELGLGDQIPAEASTFDFQALSEMSSWLAHPNEFGSYPDEAHIFDKRDLYWPPTKDNRTIYLIKYTYKGRNEDGSDEVGIGLVGSVTFSLFGLENMLQLKPIELLAVHCAWELEHEKYQNPAVGLALLKKHNKDI
jgi:hypothetical protein